MMQRVSIATGSPLLAAVIRKTLARSPHLAHGGDQRDAVAALAGLTAPGEPVSIAIVDAELLHDPADGAALRKAILARRAPTIVIDARQRGVPDAIADLASITVLRGRVGGELDLEVIETDLLAAVGSALRRGGAVASEAPVATSATPPPIERAGLLDAVLDLIVVGVSTGGPVVLLQMLKDVTEPAIPMLIVQHMPEGETARFAARLSEDSGLCVREVAGGPLPRAGTIGVLRGGGDLRIVRRSGGLHLRDAVLAGNPFHPNIDEILLSAAAADVAVGTAILTGMGQDGAAGALALAKKGLPVIAQRPDTCAVAGMPQATIDNGAARAVQSPESIASTLNRWSETARQLARGGARAPTRGPS